MNTKQDTAVELFNSGFNCAQSVFATFCDAYGIPRETALKAACGLGSGVRSGEICGAASGAVLVIGLKYGQYKPEDTEAKSNCYAKTEEFLRIFKEKNGCITCRELLGCDISDKESYALAKSKNLFKTTCTGFIKSAVSILEDLGY